MDPYHDQSEVLERIATALERIAENQEIANGLTKMTLIPMGPIEGRR